MKLTKVFEEAEENGYIVYIKEIAGVNIQGETIGRSKKEFR